MTCPICNQKIDPSDHSEKWGPEFAHSRCVIAFTAGSDIQNAKLQDRIKRLEDARTVAAANSLANMLAYEDAVAKIKRLEEAGDDLCANSCPTRWDSMQAANRKLKEQDAWRKAKEDKP